VGTNQDSATSAVIDASVVVRAYAYGDPEASAWLGRLAAGEFRPAWPSSLYPEVANAVLTLARAARIERALAEAVVAQTLRMHADVLPVEEAVADALAVAFERGLTVYDAVYVVLAEVLDAPLVTADRRLAEATEQGLLLAG
jgi:predicted nucleic acid-binding protein